MMLEHSSSRPHDARHTHVAGAAVTHLAVSPAGTQPATRDASARQARVTHGAHAFDRWLDATYGLPPLPPLDPPAEQPAGSRSLWPADHWALRAPAQPRALAAPLVRVTRAFADGDLQPARFNQHLDAAATQAWSRLPNHVSPRIPALPPATPGAVSLEATARRMATIELRLFVVCALSALLLLAGAGFALRWSSAISAGPSAAGTSRLHATGRASDATQMMPRTPGSQPTPSATAPASASGAPSPAPTHAAPKAPSVPPTAGVIPIVPTTTSLSLACSAPGTPLGLYNAGTAVQSWRITLPPGVVGNGWFGGTLTGTVNPGNTLTVYFWQLAGASHAPVTLYVQSAGQQTAVRVTFAAC